jgi:tRNA(adenine34) deaminase
MNLQPPGMEIHEARMRMALRQAKRAAEAGEVPVGAVIYNGGELAGQAWNQTQLLKDPTAHAEMLAITQAAAAAGDWRLTDSILYVTKEPCPMCAGAIVLARIPLVVWGMSDPLRGGAVSRFQILQTAELNHRADVLTGVLEEECKALVKEFFRKRRLEHRNQESDPST